MYIMSCRQSSRGVFVTAEADNEVNACFLHRKKTDGVTCFCQNAIVVVCPGGL